METKNIKIALDIDNTLNKLSPYFLQWAEYKYPFLEAEEIETFEEDSGYYKYYELHSYCTDIRSKLMENRGITLDEWYMEIFGDYKFWLDIPRVKNIFDFVYALNKRFNLFLVTYPYKFMLPSREGKLEWVRKNLPFIRRHQIIFDDKKGSLDYDIIIDDNPVMLQNAKNQKLFTVKMCHGYNKNLKTDYLFSFSTFQAYHEEHIINDMLMMYQEVKDIGMDRG